LVGFGGGGVGVRLVSNNRLRKDKFLGLHHRFLKSIVNAPNDTSTHICSHLRLVLALRVGGLLFSNGMSSVECQQEDLFAFKTSAVSNLCADEFSGLLTAALDFVSVRSKHLHAVLSVDALPEVAHSSPESSFESSYHLCLVADNLRELLVVR